MRIRLALIFSLLAVAAAVVALPAVAKSCTKAGCRAPVGAYYSKVLIVNIGAAQKGHILFEQVAGTKPFINGTCDDSKAGKFPYSPRPSAEQEWDFKGKRPKIGKVTRYRHKYKTGSEGLTSNYDITAKIHQLSAKKAVVSFSYHLLIVNSQPGAEATSHCAAAGKSKVKFRPIGT